MPNPSFNPKPANKTFSIIKKTFAYVLSVAVVAVCIVLFDFANEILFQDYPNFPGWVLPLVAALVASSIGFLMWGKLRESDALKSEFITVVTHKFRTPLTQIRWATQSLSPNLSEDDHENIAEIERASSRLVDLTNLLVQLSDTDTVDFNYQLRPMRFDAIVNDMQAEYERRAALKGLQIAFSVFSEKKITVDEAQTRFVIQTLLDNAISYTPKGGTVGVEMKEENAGKKNATLVLSVIDSGIGFSKEESGRLFEKFWRSADARKADTEGMGIGLFMARRIVERQGGTLWSESDGSDKGSTFCVKFPVKSGSLS